MNDHIVIIGAGIGGLVAAARLAHHGARVTVVERAAMPGGKLRTVDCGGVAVDAGPTVFTARWVFDALFDELGERLDDHVTVTRADRLARHSWAENGRLDLWSDPARSRDAIGDFAGAAEARGFDSFRREAKAAWDALEGRFIERPQTSAVGLAARFGLGGLTQMLAINPYATLWSALSKHFADPRLRQLYGRYATYCGSSPFEAPATLMLIAHLESLGVWLVEGGMSALARAVAAMAEARGAMLRYGCDVTAILSTNGRVSGVRLASGEVMDADAVIFNGDASALAGLMPGAAPSVAPRDRSFSALTWMMTATTRHSRFGGNPVVAPDTGGDAPTLGSRESGNDDAKRFEPSLDHHNVFFSGDYAAEFADLKGGRLPAAPTVYLCAQDRGNGARDGPERLQFIVNAPATGDTNPPTAKDIEQCETATFTLLQSCGLTLTPHSTVRAGPAEFAALFPATGGALYGRASHGWRAAFQRPGSRTGLAGLYLAGGSCHPGAGVPMAALSGRLASDALLQDRASTRPSRRAATAGGTSTRSATTANTG